MPVKKSHKDIMWSVQRRNTRNESWRFWYSGEYYSTVARRWFGYPVFYSTRKEARAKRDAYKSSGSAHSYRVVRFEHVETV